MGQKSAESGKECGEWEKSTVSGPLDTVPCGGQIEVTKRAIRSNIFNVYFSLRILLYVCLIDFFNLFVFQCFRICFITPNCSFFNFNLSTAT